MGYWDSELIFSEEEYTKYYRRSILEMASKCPVTVVREDEDGCDRSITFSLPPGAKE